MLMQQGVTAMDMPVQFSRMSLLDGLVDYHGLSDNETIVFAAIFDAAERGLPCPTGEDLNDLLDCSSDSASRGILDRLITKGLLSRAKVQRFRQVQILATGKWTAKSEAMKTETPHVPRGTHDPRPLVKALDDVGIADSEQIASSFPLLLAWETRLTRAIELINRRKVHFLTGEA